MGRKETWKDVSLLTHVQRPSPARAERGCISSITVSEKLLKSTHQDGKEKKREKKKKKEKKIQSREEKVEGSLSECESQSLFQQLIPPSKYTAHIK